MRYQVAGNKIFSGLTRVVWELEEVNSGQGGTTFLSGSHKAHFNYGGPDRYHPNIEGSLWVQWHKNTLGHQEIEAMPPKRRSLFRGTWATGEPEGNRAYSLENRAV